MPSASDQVQIVKDLVRAMVFRAELPEGSRIVEEDLRKLSGATYRAVRRALVDLTGEGLLTRKRHAGTFVARRVPEGVKPSLPPVSSVAIVSSLSGEIFGRTPFLASQVAGIRSALGPPAQVAMFLRQGAGSGPIDSLPVLHAEAMKGAVQGVVALEANNAAVLNDLVRAGLAVVAVDYCVPRASFDVVAIDHQEAGYLATSHLLSLGHRKIAFVGEGPNYRSADPTWQDRLAGYLRAVAEAGGEVPWQGIVNVHRSAEMVGRRLPEFHRKHGPTAYVLCTGSLVAETLKVLGAIGLSCPQDVSVACADGVEQSFAAGGISHARVDHGQVGENAVRALAARRACRAMPAFRVVIPVGFKPGESSRAPGR